MNEHQIRILGQSDKPQVRMIAAESLAQDGRFYEAAQIAYGLGYMETAFEYALAGYQNGDRKCTFTMVDAVPHLGNFALEMFVILSDVRAHIGDKRVADEYHDPSGRAHYALKRAAELQGQIGPGQVSLQFYRDLLQVMTLKNEVTVHCQHFSKDTDRPDLESRLPGLVKVELPVYTRN